MPRKNGNTRVLLTLIHILFSADTEQMNFHGIKR